METSLIHFSFQPFGRYERGRSHDSVDVHFDDVWTPWRVGIRLQKESLLQPTNGSLRRLGDIDP